MTEQDQVSVRNWCINRFVIIIQQTWPTNLSLQWHSPALKLKETVTTIFQ